MSELTELLHTLANATDRNPTSAKSRLLRSQVKSQYKLTDSQIDEELAKLASMG